MPPPDVVFTKQFRDSLKDLTGKTIAITGCTSGTGYVAAMESVSKGAKVLMLNRKSDRSKAATAAVESQAKNKSVDWRAGPTGLGAKPAGPGQIVPESTGDQVCAPILSCAAKGAEIEK